MFCEKCGNQLKATDKFCPKCGAVQSSKVVQDVTPKKSENPVSVNNDKAQSVAQNEQPQNFVQNQQQNPVQNVQSQNFVQNQQQYSAQNVQSQNFVQNQQQSPISNEQPQNFAQNFNSQVPTQKTSKFFTKKKMIIGGVSLGLVVVIAAGVIAVPKLFTGGSGSKFDGVLYLKDGALNINYKNKDKSFEIDDLERNVTSVSATLSSDSKYLFYINDSSLYRADISKKDFEKNAPEKISSLVSSYNIGSNGNRVVYLTSDDKLYLSDINDKNKIDSDVSAYYASEDLSKIYYITKDDNKLYYYENGKDSNKIANNVTIKYKSDDLSTIYYVSKDSLYLLKSGSEPQKLDIKIDDNDTDSDKSSSSSYSSSSSSISSIQLYAVNNNGTFFYTYPSELSLSVIDYIDDDMETSDKDLTKPNYYDSKYKNNYSAYYDDYYAYLGKSDRDELRTEVKNISTCKLCYFNGTSSTDVSSSVSSVTEATYDNNSNGTADRVAYFENDYSDIGKVAKMSETVSKDGSTAITKYDIYDKIVPKSSISYSTGSSSIEVVSVKNSSYSDSLNMKITEDSKSLCYIDDETLYKADISSDKSGEPVKIMDDVSSFDIIDSKVFSLSDNALYIDGVKIADDVSRYDYVDGKVYYLTDVDTSSYHATLMKYNGKDSVKISEDVSLYQIIDENNIYMLYDFNKFSEDGDLIRYNGKDTETIDSDVSYIYQITQDGEMRHPYY